MSFMLAADVGGTNLRLAIVEPDGNIVEEVRLQADLSRVEHDSATAAETFILDTLCSAFQPLLVKADISAIGIGFPGFFIGDSGILASSPNLPQLQNFALAKQLNQRLKIKVVAQNDALCAALGEYHFGIGSQSKNLLHITLGTGIGGGLILNGLPHTGEHGMAMEFGHLCVMHDKQARICGCGGAGCVEAYASATAIMSAYAKQTAIITDCLSIYQAALSDDAIAINILKEAGFYLGRAIAEAIKLVDVETVSISGGLSGAWDILYEPMMTELNDNLIPPLKGKINILRSTLNDQGGLLGAAALASS